MDNLHLYVVFAYNAKKGFQECIRIVSELSWEKVSSGYFGRKHKSNQIVMWHLADARNVDTVKYAELNLLDNAILIDENCREADATDFRREFIMRKFAGI